METVSVSPSHSAPSNGDGAAPQAQAILMLGMHRSGTSLLARLVNLLGTDVGTDLLPPAPDNETGFWENRQVMMIHDEIYAAFDRYWNSMSGLPAQWWEESCIQPQRHKLHELLVGTFGKSALWGVKDPRLADMLPLWRAILNDLSIAPRCIMIVRNPAEVARSLQKRNEMPALRSHLLWLRNLLQTERHARGLPGIVVSYESLLNDWRGQLQRIGLELQIDWPRSIDSAAPAIAEFLRPEMRHHVVDDHAFLEDAAAPEPVRRVFRAALGAAVSGRIEDLSRTCDDVARELESSPLLTQLIAEADAWFRKSQIVNERLAAVQAEAAKLQQQLSSALSEHEAQQKSQAQQLTDAMRDCNRHIKRLNRNIARRKERRRARQQAKPKHTVAVVIPFFNGSEFIERAVQSVLEQTVPADELIIVNDGSRTEERTFLDKLAGRYTFRIIDQENGGQGSARNTGVRESKAPYICFLDQDDYYLADHIETLTHAIPLNDRRFGWIYADLCMADKDGNIFRSEVIKEHAVHPKRNLINLIGHDMFVLPSASLVSRTAYEAVGGFDPQFTGYEDDDLFMRLFREGFSNYFIDKPVTVWRMYPGSTSFSIRMCRSRLKFFKKLVQQFPDVPKENKFFFRDCLMPRFGPNFMLDAIRAAEQRDPNRDEIAQILREYSKTVCAHPHVSRKYKLKLRMASSIFSDTPIFVVKAVNSFTNLPILRGVRRLV